MHFRPRRAPGLSRSQPLPKPPRPRGRKRRLFIRAFLILAVLGVAALSYLIFHDTSSALLDRQIQSRWLAATGLPLAYDRAVVRLSRGTLDIDHPRLLDPQNGAPLLGFTRIRIEIPPGQFFHSGAPYIIRAINIDSSLTLLLVAGERGVKLGEPWARVVALARGHQEHRRAMRGDRRTSPTFALDHVTLNTLSVHLTRERDGHSQALTQIDGARLRAEFGGQPLPRQIVAEGRLNNAGAERGLTLELLPGPRGDSAELKLALARFDSLKDLPWRLPVDFSATGLELNARAARTGNERWTLTGASTARNLTVAGADARPDQALGDAAARWDLTLDNAAGRLDLRAAALDSKVCAFQTSGTLGLGGPRDYTLSIGSLKAQGPVFALIAGLLGRGPEVARPGEATLSLNATLRGALARRLPDAVTGHAELTGFNLAAPELPPMQNLSLQAELTSHALLIERAQGIVQGMPMAFLGRINGRPLSGEISSADITWKADGDLVSVATLIKSGTANASAQQMELKGKVAGAGRFYVREPLAGSLVSALERARLEGRIEFKDVTLRHPQLLEPLRNVNGRVDFIENSARLTQGSGEWMGAAVTLAGTLKGKPLIWNKPRLALNGAARFNLAQTRARLAAGSPQAAQTMKSWPRLAGAGELKLTLDGELARPESADYRATLDLTDFSTDLTHPQCHGRLDLAELRLAATPRELRIKRARGTLGGLKLDLDAALTPASGTLHLKESGALAEVKSRIPILLKLFRVGGTADLDAALTFAARRDFKPPATWPLLAATIRELPSTTDWPRWAGARWAFDGGGKIMTRDMEMTYNPMPARLWAISGPISFDMKHLWTPKPLPIRGGNRSRDCFGKIDLVFGTNLNDALAGKPLRPFVFNYLVTGGVLGLEEWLKPWEFSSGKPSGPPKPPAPEIVDPNAKRVFIMHGEFQLDQATYLGVLMHHFRAKLDLDVTPAHYANFFTWQGVTGQIGDGEFSASGKMVGRDVASDASMRLIDLNALIKGLTGKEHASGLFSGRLSGSMRVHQGWAWPQSPPLEGSGSLRITESRFVSNSVFRGLGGVLNLVPFFEEITFNTIEGPFEFKGDRYMTPGITFVNPMIVRLVAVGAFGPQQKLDLDLQLHILPKALTRIPLVGGAIKMMNNLIGKVLKFKVRGTLDKPTVLPL